MSFDYKNLEHTALYRLTTANNKRQSKIRHEFFVKENEFFKKHFNNKFILVAGSGLGHDSFRIAKYNKKIIGIDILPLLVKRSNEKAKKRKTKNIKFKVGDFTKLKYSNSHFDVAVLNMGTIGNFDDKEKVIKKLIRVAKEVYVDFYIGSIKALRKRKKMYEEELWKNVRIVGKDIVSKNGLETQHISKKELKLIANKLKIKVSFHKFSDIGIMAIFKK